MCIKVRALHQKFKLNYSVTRMWSSSKYSSLDRIPPSPRYISLNPLFFSQKNTFFPRKRKQIYSKYLPSLIFFPSFGQFVYTTPKKFLIFQDKPLIKPFSDVVRIEVSLSERVAHENR